MISKKHDEEKGDHEDYEGQRGYHVTIGQARRYVQRTHQKIFLEWIYQQAFSGIPAEELFASLVA